MRLWLPRLRLQGQELLLAARLLRGEEREGGGWLQEQGGHQVLQLPGRGAHGQGLRQAAVGRAEQEIGVDADWFY